MELFGNEYNDPDMIYIFPELRESGDERMIRFIANELMCLRAIDSKGSDRYKELTNAIAWIEKQGEQKPADKVEPKFKVGDWVVQENIGVYKIIEICESWYEVISYNDGIQYSIGFDNENDCHLWTTQDAKEGDVLVASDSSIFIFKEVVELGCKYYIALTKDNEAINVNDNLEHCWETSRAVHPATKEQRDLLFSKMKEAGYEWDEENKELKKIEQKPEIKDDVLSRFAFYQYDDDTIYLSSLFIRESNRGRGYGSKILKAADEVAKTFGVSKIRLKVERNTWMDEWYKKNGYEYISAEGKYDWLEKQRSKEENLKEHNICDTCEESNGCVTPCCAKLLEKQGEQKPAWSEEDEKIKYELEVILANTNLFSIFALNYTFSDMISWLKSLKERMQPQNNTKTQML